MLDVAGRAAQHGIKQRPRLRRRAWLVVATGLLPRARSISRSIRPPSGSSISAWKARSRSSATSSSSVGALLVAVEAARRARCTSGPALALALAPAPQVAAEAGRCSARADRARRQAAAAWSRTALCRRCARQTASVRPMARNSSAPDRFAELGVDSAARAPASAQPSMSRRGSPALPAGLPSSAGVAAVAGRRCAAGGAAAGRRDRQGVRAQPASKRARMRASVL